LEIIVAKSNLFTSKGVKKIDDIDEAEPNGHIVIRAHGVTPDIYKKISDKKKIHNLVKSEEGYKIIIVGDRNHPDS